MSSFIFIGGDKRMLHGAEKLGRAYICGFDKLMPCTDINDGGVYDYAVLPVQKSADGINIPCPFSEKNIPYSVLGDILKKGATVFTGNVCPELERVCREKGFRLINYLEREELAVRNAVLTAEGALPVIINELSFSVFGTEILITGFGRIAKILARYLSVMGAHVTAACRKPRDREWARFYGCKTADINDKNQFLSAVASAQVILNTVPYRIFGDSEVAVMSKGALYIELASEDGISGTVPEGVRVITARGLPGKTAPVTAGGIIADTILNIISEEGGTDYEN